MITNEVATRFSSSELYYELINSIEDRTIREVIQKKFAIEKVRENYEAAIKFCEVIATERILDFLHKCRLSSYKNAVQEEVIKILEYRTLCRNSSDAFIYSCFLYFSGIIPFIPRKKLEELQVFFEYNSKYGEEIRKKDLFNFLKIYTNIVHPSTDDLILFHELKNCLMNDNHGVIFDARKRALDNYDDYKKDPS